LPAATEPVADGRVGRVGAALAGLRSAAAFLTIVPVPLAARPDGGFADAPAWFPLIGAAIGAAAGGVRAGLEPIVGRPAATGLAMVVIAVITGALHLDGLADSADGLGVRGDRSHRLEVMRDSANGTFGTLALVLWGLVTFAALASVSARQCLELLIAAAACGRWLGVVHGRLLAPARGDGLGSAFSPGPVQVGVGAMFAVAASLLALGPAHGAIVFAAALAAGAVFSGFAHSAYGGQTGDTIGACVVLAETAAILAGVAVLSA